MNLGFRFIFTVSPNQNIFRVALLLNSYHFNDVVYSCTVADEGRDDQKEHLDRC